MTTANRLSMPGPSRPGLTITAIIVLGLGSLLFLASLASAIPMILSHFTDNWNGFANLSTYGQPLGQDPASSESGSAATYSGVLLSSTEALVLPRTLQLAQTLVTLLVVLTGSLAAVLLAIRLLQRKPFARHLRLSLIVLGVLIIALATVGPQLEALAVDAAAQALGYPIYPEIGDGILTATTPDSIMLNLWDPISVVGRIDLILLVVGGIVAMLGALIAVGERIQHETDGLI